MINEGREREKEGDKSKCDVFEMIKLCLVIMSFEADEAGCCSVAVDPVSTRHQDMAWR